MTAVVSQIAADEILLDGEVLGQGADGDHTSDHLHVSSNQYDDSEAFKEVVVADKEHFCRNILLVGAQVLACHSLRWGA